MIRLKDLENSVKKMVFTLKEKKDSFHLMAYTTGIPVKHDLDNGNVVEGWDICGLRYSKVPTLEWQKKYDLPDYIYFEAIPTKEPTY